MPETIQLKSKAKGVHNGGGYWPADRPGVCIIDGQGYVVRAGPPYRMEDGLEHRDLVTRCIGPVDEKGDRLPAWTAQPPFQDAPHSPQGDENGRTKIEDVELHGGTPPRPQTDNNAGGQKRGRGRPRKVDGAMSERTLRRRRAEVRRAGDRRQLQLPRP